MMNELERKEWLDTLTVQQLLSLASQYKVPQWLNLPKQKLILALASIEGIEVPKQV